MPTISSKEPTKESQTTKPSVLKWGCEGPLLIYLVLPLATKVLALVGTERIRLRGGAHGGGEGTHAYTNRACMLTRRGPRMSARDTHPYEGGVHAYRGRARQLEGAYASGIGRVRLLSRADTPTRTRAHTSAGGAHPFREGAHDCRVGHARVLGKVRTLVGKALLGCMGSI